jgi:hypothetical protein
MGRYLWERVQCSRSPRDVHPMLGRALVFQGSTNFFPRSNLGRFARPCTLCKEGLPRELSAALPRMGGCGTWMGRRGAHPGEATTAPGERRPLSQGGFYPFSGCPGTFVWAAPLAMGAIGRFLGRTGASRGEHRTFCGKGRTFHGKRERSTPKERWSRYERRASRLMPLVWCLQETFTPQIACESGVPRLEGTPSWRHYTRGW